MELNKIEQLLDAYFEGETSLDQEKALRDYFTSDNVSDHLEMYIPMFSAFAEAKKEKFIGEINLPTTNKSWKWIPVAASIAVVMGLFLMLNTNKINEQDYGTYKDPEVAALKTKQALLMVSNFMNQGTDQLEVLGEFQKTTDKFLK